MKGYSSFISPIAQNLWNQIPQCITLMEEGMTIPSSILAWRIPWTEEGYSPWGHKELDTSEATQHSTAQRWLRRRVRHPHMIWCRKWASNDYYKIAYLQFSFIYPLSPLPLVLCLVTISYQGPDIMRDPMSWLKEDKANGRKTLHNIILIRGWKILQLL